MNVHTIIQKQQKNYLEAIKGFTEIAMSIDPWQKYPWAS